ncbi:hypothetical protein ACJIZ3_022629 [Penstemon smallii]|uniref:Uncharacterized protein n=1 Tax=Penstemon smallii TaxID=265156 RepID=A0ABD3TPP8_9LAMI
MANNGPSSSSITLSFLGVLKQPNFSDPNNLDFDESFDVVWSFFPSSPSPPYIYHHHHRRFDTIQSGLSAALEDCQRHLISRRPIIIPAAAPRPENIPAKFHQSAPINIPVWPKTFRGKYNDNNANFNKFEEESEVEEERVMEPPHVTVARSHVTFSVFEGVGRTLKGRDLRRVRNAVFQKTVTRIYYHDFIRLSVNKKHTISSSC